jgi:hypothetical protein
LTYLFLHNTSVSGDISALSGLTSLVYIYLYNTNVDVGTDTFPAWNGTDIRVQDNGWNATQVDNFLIYLDNGGGVSGTLNIAGTNATRTPASDAAKTSLLGKGWTITVNE